MSQINDALKHEVQLQRVATKLIKGGVYKSLDEAYKAVRLILLDAEKITSPTKLNAVTKKISAAVDEAISRGWAEYTGELETIAIYDAEYYAGMMSSVAGKKLSVPAKKTITDYINKSLMSLSNGQSPKVGVWSEFVSENTSGVAEQINNLVKAGYVNNATVGQMTTSIRQFSENLGKQQAEALARTGLQHYSQQARKAMAEDNLDILDREYPLVTFDNRTSSKCMGISVHYPDGWEVGKSPVGSFPAHYNCRTIIIYGVKGMGDPRKSIEKPAVGSGENYPEDSAKKPIYKGRRSNKGGKFNVEQIPASTPFGTWLKSQDRAFVDDVLGPTRAKLFLDGGLDIRRMSDAFGNELSLDALRKIESSAFSKAGI